jgi:predicted esterase
MPLARRISFLALAALVATLATPIASRASSPRVPRSSAAEHAALADQDVRAQYPSSPVAITRAQGAPPMLAFPPAPRAAHVPVTFVYLHGAHGLAEKGCPYFRRGASELGWLVCPEAIERDGNGLWSWGADLRAQARVLDEAVATARANGARAALPVVVGFSQGSFVLLDLVKTHLARARGLVLLGADVHPDVALLRAAGVERVALGSGALDAPYRTLAAEVARLEREGMPARFVDLGAVGHTYATEDVEALDAALLWAAGDAVSPAS